jgi:hypothetical protein
MTTIIFDSKKLYADTQFSVVNDDDGEVPSHTFTGNKIWKINDTYCAGAGSLVVVNLMRDFVHNWSIKYLGFTFIVDISGDSSWAAAANGTHSHVIVIRKSQPTVYQLHTKIKAVRVFHKIFTFITVNAKSLPINPDLPNIFLGSGQDYAIDFMSEGHDPVTAIKMTAEHDIWTNNIVHAVEV